MGAPPKIPKSVKFVCGYVYTDSGKIWRLRVHCWLGGVLIIWLALIGEGVGTGAPNCKILSDLHLWIFHPAR